MIFQKSWLRVKRVDMRYATRHEQEDHVLCLRRMMRGLQGGSVWKLCSKIAGKLSGCGETRISHQSRFKNFSVQDDTHFYVLCRYVLATTVEQNRLREESTLSQRCVHMDVNEFNFCDNSSLYCESLTVNRVAASSIASIESTKSNFLAIRDSLVRR